MTLEESERNTISDHILDWLDSLEGSITFLPPFLKDPYNSGQINGDHWWVQNQDLDKELVNPISTSFNNSTTTRTTGPLLPAQPHQNPPPQTISNRPMKKRKSFPFRNHLKVTGRIRTVGSTTPKDGDGVKRSVGGKKSSAKLAGNNCNNGYDREERWAEQLLKPCAAVVTTGNLTPIQNLVYFLLELSSPAETLTTTSQPMASAP
ncbi:hypothetical protein Acr_16g0009250 [Actinidia rufa]|uniref:Uncharacterized protein n=1 Tax=Actinidia rufa TaxID=165716 RepID=A0A7J0G036_9ERIC|nr:hypothetical protein Acr_16g0009250 [Actinidia rufa]